MLTKKDSDLKNSFIVLKSSNKKAKPQLSKIFEKNTYYIVILNDEKKTGLLLNAQIKFLNQCF